MWKPKESLDDFFAKPAPEVKPEAPRSVLLEGTGEVEVLKPLTRVKVRTRPGRYVFKAPLQPLWFRRFLAVGSGALVIVALALVSAILVGINDPGDGPDVAMNETIDEPLTQPDEPFNLEIASLSPNAHSAEMIRFNSRRRPTRSTYHLAASRPAPQLRAPLQAEEPTFVPTTLVIYAENGVINTRIEPWFPDGDKKTTTFNN